MARRLRSPRYPNAKPQSRPPFVPSPAHRPALHVRPELDDGCPSCSAGAHAMAAAFEHSYTRDTSFAIVSRRRSRRSRWTTDLTALGRQEDCEEPKGRAADASRADMSPDPVPAAALHLATTCSAASSGEPHTRLEPRPAWRAMRSWD